MMHSAVADGQFLDKYNDLQMIAMLEAAGRTGGFCATGDYETKTAEMRKTEYFQKKFKKRNGGKNQKVQKFPIISDQPDSQAILECSKNTQSVNPQYAFNRETLQFYKRYGDIYCPKCYCSDKPFLP